MSEPVTFDCCGTSHARATDLDHVETAVYDALFPEVLRWSEGEDCGMSALMADVARAASSAAREALAADLAHQQALAATTGDLYRADAFESAQRIVAGTR